MSFNYIQKYEELLSSLKSPPISNEDKLEIIQFIIYPEYKKGTKTIEYLSYHYNIEKKLIENYIKNIESFEKSFNLNNNISGYTDNNEDNINYRLSLLEQKLDFIISKFNP